MALLENMEIKDGCLYYRPAGAVGPRLLVSMIKQGMEDGGRKVVSYVPNTFHQSPRFLIEHVGIDTFLMTVSPMDRHGYFSLGTGNDYSSKVARAAHHLLVEENEHMPRVTGAGAQNNEPGNDKTNAGRRPAHRPSRA